MTDPSSLVSTAAEAALALNQARHDAQTHEESGRSARARTVQLRQRRDSAIWHLGHDCGLENAAISRALVAELQHRGLSLDVIAALGVSQHTVGRIVREEAME